MKRASGSQPNGGRPAPALRRARRIASHLPARLGWNRAEHFHPPHGTDLDPYLALGDEQSVHHLLRYHWAAAVLQDAPPRRVVDVACGTGYGTRILAEALPSSRVLGVDLDPRAIRHARSTPSPGNASFLVGDVMRWDETIGPDRVECIVSFETIEHVPHRELMLMALVEHLTPEGSVLFSTPIRSNGPLLSPPWRHHRIEYSPRTLLDLLHRYFEVVLRPDNASLPGLEVFERLEGHDVGYLLRMNPLLLRSPIAVENDPRDTNPSAHHLEADVGAAPEEAVGQVPPQAADEAR